MRDKRPRCPTCGHLLKKGALNPNWRGGFQKGRCEVCGGPTWHKSARRCRACYEKQLSERTGSANPEWNKFTSTKKAQGWDRAKRRFPLGACERCGKPARHRHHKDENPLNNNPSNILRLCRSCHRYEHLFDK